VLYEAFGWKPPVFVHLPLLHSLDGKKLSKRDTNGDKSFLVKHYQQGGILPEALVNYVALFGWSSRQESDVYSMQELIDQVHPSLEIVINSSFRLIA
jgi:glutamyl/glutaminyl-tRNA synthetase